MAIINNLVIRLALLHGERNLAKGFRRFDAKPEKTIQSFCAAL